MLVVITLVFIFFIFYLLINKKIGLNSKYINSFNNINTFNIN